LSISVSIPKEGDKSRNYDELMEELLKVRCRDKGDGDTKVIDFANAEARRLERMTHIRRDTLEKIIFLFSSLVEDMEKVEMTKEEKKILLQGTIPSLAETLGISRKVITMVLELIPEETGNLSDDNIVEAIMGYCEDMVSRVAGRINLPESLVDKILFLSNIMRWCNRDNLSEEWWENHFMKVARAVEKDEALVRRIIDTELTILGEDNESDTD
jgi:hypothetical protein